MRLGLVIYGSLANVSGGYLYDRMVVEHLRRLGDDVDIVSLPWRRYAWHLLDNASRPLLRRLRDARFDVLLQDELNHPSLFWLNRRLRGRYPIISIVHHLRSSELRPAWQNRLYRRVERLYLAGVGGFVFNSQTTRAAVEGLAGASRPSVVAHPGGDHVRSALTANQISARAHRSGPLQLVFVGNLTPRKGLHTLVAALAHLPPRDWRLLVVGNTQADQPYTRVVRRQIERLQMSANIRLLGSLPEAQLAEALTGAHALVVPSSYEGFGIVYLEGMAFGLPAIASTVGAAREVITHGEDGLLVAPDDSAALAEHLRVLMTDRGRLARMGLAARRRYDAHPGWAHTAARIRDFLLSLISRA